MTVGIAAIRVDYCSLEAKPTNKVQNETCLQSYAEEVDVDFHESSELNRVFFGEEDELIIKKAQPGDEGNKQKLENHCYTLSHTITYYYMQMHEKTKH